jgi:hypothetical protein
MGGNRPYALSSERNWLLKRLAEQPDVTLRGLLAELAERGIKVSYYAVWHFFEHEGISFKKSLHASEQDRPDVARRRAQWKKYQGRLDPSRLVFIDETWAKTNMTRTHGRARRGERLVAKAPHGRWRTLTFLAALRHDRIDAPCVIDGPAKASWPMSSRCWCQRSSPATLSSSTISAVTRERPSGMPSAPLAQSCSSCRPPHSPDINPIEQAFAKLKILLRKKGFGTNRRGDMGTHRRLAGLFLSTGMRQLLRQRGYAST